MPWVPSTPTGTTGLGGPAAVTPVASAGGSNDASVVASPVAEAGNESLAADSSVVATGAETKDGPAVTNGAETKDVAAAAGGDSSIADSNVIAGDAEKKKDDVGKSSSIAENEVDTRVTGKRSREDTVDCRDDSLRARTVSSDPKLGEHWLMWTDEADDEEINDTTSIQNATDDWGPDILELYHLVKVHIDSVDDDGTFTCTTDVSHTAHEAVTRRFFFNLIQDGEVL